MNKFVHLHVHSHYSLLDGLGKIDELVARAKELELPALALTDHGNMHGAVEFYTKCKKAGIKPILGVEAYLAPRGMLDKVPKVDSVAYHQLLLAKNEQGYQNLLHLVSEAHTKGMYYKPRIDLKLLTQYSNGLIGTSSCLAGMIPEAIVAGDMEKAISLAKQFLDLFEGDFYLELQHHPSLDNQIKANQGLKQIAQELNIPLIATGDVHYVRPADKETQEVLLAINTGKDLASDDRMTFGDVDVSMQGEDFFKNAFADVPEIIANTAQIADACEVELKLGETILPYFPLPNGFTNDMDYLRHLTYVGAKERYGDLKPSDRERIEYELSVIAQTGFANYFLIVADFVTWAKDHGILVGPGRGSAAGSMVTYSLRISDINPIAYNPPLIFERFLNPDRIEMPDIDLDFADDRRHEVIQYVRDKYGADHVAGIATFGTMMGRAAVRDVGRVLGMPYGEVDEIAKLVPQPVQGKHIPLKTAIENVPELKERYDSNPQIKRLLDLAIKIEGTVRHASQHASAFVISKDPLVSYSPVQPTTKGEIGLVTQYSMKPIAEIGLLKMDFLGLSNLTIINNALRIIQKVYGDKIDIHQIPLDDKKTFSLLARGETTGIFQLESDGMKRYIKELKPDRFEDIIAMVSLYRPGPMQAIPSYIARKHGKEAIAYDHELLKNSLAETYGVIVYQEQVMQASKDLAGFTGGEADTLRKAMGKKIAALMNQMKPKFYAGCEKNGISQSTAEVIFGKFETFSAYGFNKAHAACYAMIAYQTAYLKANYPAAFFAALLTSNADNLEKMSIEMQEAEKMGIKVLPPDVNESFPEFGVIKQEQGIEASYNDSPQKAPVLMANKEKASTGARRTQTYGERGTESVTPLDAKLVTSDYIRFGLGAIKNVGHGVSEAIVQERQNNGPFNTLTDFLMRLGPSVLNKRVLESLAMTGALDRFGERNALVQSVESMVRFLANRKKDTSQIGLFGSSLISLVQDIVLLDVPPAQKRTCLEWEKTLLGLYLSGHPLKEIEHIIPHIATQVGDITSNHAGKNQRVAGIITELRVINTKSNEAMAFVKLEDFTGTMELVVFPRTWAEVKTFAQTDRYIVADGRVDTRDNSAKLIVSRILELHPEEEVGVIKAALGPIPKANAFSHKKNLEKKSTSVTPPVTTLNPGRLLLAIPNSLTKKSLEEIRFLLESHPGKIPVFIQAIRDGAMTYAKTRSYVQPNRNLLLLLKQIGIDVILEGAKPVDEEIESQSFAQDSEPAIA